MRVLGSFFALCLLLNLASCAAPKGAPRQEIRSDEIAYASSVKKAAPKIVIDAGHGGKDFGAVSKSANKVQEKNLNLKTALMVDRMLRKLGYETILTRGDDFAVPLDLRANLANSNRATLFVSIHYNAASSVRAEGVEVFYYNDEKDVKRREESKRLANLVLDNITNNVEIKSRGVKKGNLAVIRETKMPAVLIEGGFVTNDKELSKLVTPEFQRRLAFGIVKAIYQFLNS